MDLMRRQRFCKQETLQHTTSHLGQGVFLLRVSIPSATTCIFMEWAMSIIVDTIFCIFAVLVDIFNKYSVNFLIPITGRDFNINIFE